MRGLLREEVTATFDAAGKELFLLPNSVYQVSFDVDGSNGLLKSTLGLFPTFGLEMLDGAGHASYLALYELDSPAVLLSKEWAEAGEQGRWPKEVRPYTLNRSHVVRKVI